MDRRNGEGYTDPTAYDALKAVEREGKAQDRKHDRVYICSPYRGRTENEIAGNVRDAIRYSQQAAKQGYLPICPHIYLTQFLNDGKPDERKLGLAMGLELLRDCRELWVCGERVSEGMKNEIAEAKRLGITVKHFESQEEIRP